MSSFRGDAFDCTVYRPCAGIDYLFYTKNAGSFQHIKKSVHINFSIFMGICLYEFAHNAYSMNNSINRVPIFLKYSCELGKTCYITGGMNEIFLAISQAIRYGSPGI